MNNMEDSDFQQQLQKAFQQEAKDHFLTLNKTLDQMEKKEGDPSEQIKVLFRAAHSLKGSSQAVNLLPVSVLCQDLENLFSDLKKGDSELSKEQIQTLFEKFDEIEKAIFGESKKKTSSVEKKESFEATVRVRLDKLENLLHQVEELLMVKLKFKEHLNSLKKLGLDSNKLQEWEQSERLAANRIDSVLKSAKQLLMVPLNTIFESYPKMVRDLSKTLEKDVELQVFGDDLEVDRRILECLHDPLMHVIRNSIDHGIETPSQRRMKGKSEKGLLKISASQHEGKTFKIKIEDDGKGVDVEKVKQKGLELGWISQTDLEKLSEDQICQFIFKPGFSTTDAVTQISGRGVGLDVLVENVESMGGTLNLWFEKDKGTTLTITLPLTLATFRGIHLEVLSRSFILPTESVVRVMRYPTGCIKTIEGEQVIQTAEDTYPYFYLGEVLRLGQDPKKMGYQTVVILKYDRNFVGFGVDEIDREEEVFVKRLEAPLVQVKDIAAATIAEGGKIIPILHPIDLIKNAFGKKGLTHHAGPTNQTSQKSILVVEDSLTTRILLKNILESSGFKVFMATDGREALTALSKQVPDLMLSDVEMPALDGFSLTEKVRQTENLKDLPVILCTSRASKEDQERGVQVGANGYLNKSTFTQSALLQMIKQLIGS
jgi:two-component system chemotaxis sensor kinase CheA